MTGNTAGAKAGRTGTGGHSARLCGKPGAVAGRAGQGSQPGPFGGSLPPAWPGAAGDARPCSSCPSSPQSCFPRSLCPVLTLLGQEVVRDPNSRNVAQSPAFS